MQTSQLWTSHEIKKAKILNYILYQHTVLVSSGCFVSQHAGRKLQKQRRTTTLISADCYINSCVCLPAAAAGKTRSRLVWGAENLMWSDRLISFSSQFGTNIFSNLHVASEYLIVYLFCLWNRSLAVVYFCYLLQLLFGLFLGWKLRH